jgi:flagellar protein FliO/FliZ
MTTAAALTSLAWFVAILALIPLALWLLKRSRAVGTPEPALLRSIATLPLGPGQRLVTVEVGGAEARRWLVLGVTAQSITTLHEMAAPADCASSAAPPDATFSQLLQRIQRRATNTHAR